MSASAAASQGSGVRYMERPAVPRALDTEEENHAVLAVQSSPHLRAGHQPSWMLNHMMPHGHAAGFGYGDPRHAHAEHCKSMREVQENAQQHHMKRMHEVATEPLHSRDYTPWTGAAMTSGMTGGAPASETLYSRDVVPGTNNGTFEALSHPMPGSATWQYFYDQSPAAQKPVLEPNVAADKHLPKQREYPAPVSPYQPLALAFSPFPQFPFLSPRVCLPGRLTILWLVERKRERGVGGRWM